MNLKSQKITNEYLGNNELINNLFDQLNKNILQNSILLFGNKGIGKATSVYYIFKKLFNIETEKKIHEFIHPNFYYLSKIFDSSKNEYKKNISIDQIRLCNDYIKLTSLNDQPRIILIDSIDEFNLNASNSLLKILEEPPKNVYFFLISHQINSILPTIKSRCIKYNVKEPNFSSFNEIIKINYPEISELEIKDLFYLSNASPGNAINFINYNFINIKDEIINILLNKNFLNDNLINFSNNIYKDNDKYTIFVYLIKFILLNIIKCQNKIYDYQELSFKDEIIELSQFLSYNRINDILDYLDENEKLINIYNLDKKIFIINCFSKLLQKK